MPLDIREFEVMTNDTLARIVNSNVGVSNTSVGSVVRAIVEAIVNEIDIEYYQLNRVYNALGIDKATGDDLDALVEILGVVRKPAEKAVGVVTFSMTEVSTSDVAIQYATYVSTKPDYNGNVIEFITTDTNAVIKAGTLSVDVNVQALNAGKLYVPVNGLSVMNNPIIGVESVSNRYEINGGKDIEDDDSLRERARSALSNLGKGTCASLKSAIMNISGVHDVMVIDMASGVGTATVIIVTDIMPASSEIVNAVNTAVSDTKSAGINITITYPTVVNVPVTVTTETVVDHAIIGKAISDYINALGISESFIINQMERSVLNACDIDTMDITTVAPTSNVSVTTTQIIRPGTITINGVVYNG